MVTPRTRTSFAAAVLALALAPAVARADEPDEDEGPPMYDLRSHVQVVAAGGVTAGRLVGFDIAPALRFFTPEGHGLMLRFVRAWQSDPAFRPGCDQCPRTLFTLVDAAYAHRWVLDGVGRAQWVASLYEGVTVGPRYSERAFPDGRPGLSVGRHTSAGAFLGAGIDVFAGGVLVGFEVEVRMLVAVDDGRVPDDTLVSARLRLGVDFPLARGRSWRTAR